MCCSSCSISIICIIMGTFMSKEDTVVTTWRKHEPEILRHVDDLASTFIQTYCTVEPHDYMPNVHALVCAFDEYMMHHLPAQHWESYKYNTTLAMRFEHLVKRYPHVRVLSHDVVVGISLTRWIIPAYQRIQCSEEM